MHEDRRRCITWTVMPEIGAVQMRGEGLCQLPWTKVQSEKAGNDKDFLIFPRHTLTDQDFAEASTLAESDRIAVAFLCPDGERAPVPRNISLITCPDTVEAIDRSIERRLLASRVGRS